MSTMFTWLEPLRTSIPELDDLTWNRLHHLATDLADVVAGAPRTDDQAARSQWLLHTRRWLAEHGHHAPTDPAVAAVWQTLAQFCAGFQDLNLRDATGPGHGSMILHEAPPATADAWAARLNCGDLVGIAATERHGGSRIRDITTRARLAPAGQWWISGEKVWISRLTESAAFVAFFRDPDGRISAAVIDATDHRLDREVIPPLGLDGWTWGVLRLRDVPIDPRTDLVGHAGDGLGVFRRHFTRFRPLVTATALGTAAGVHTLVTNTLASRQAVGILSRIRDHALITLGRTHAEITAALLLALTTSRLAAAGHPDADLTARLGKATGVDTAYQAVTDLAPLLGATGFQHASPLAQARTNLTGLLFADGIHDSLYRSGGISLVSRPSRQAHPEPTVLATGRTRRESPGRQRDAA